MNGHLNGSANKSIAKGNGDIIAPSAKSTKGTPSASSSTSNSFGAVVSIAARYEQLSHFPITPEPVNVEKLFAESPAAPAPAKMDEASVSRLGRLWLERTRRSHHPGVRPPLAGPSRAVRVIATEQPPAPTLKLGKLSLALPLTPLAPSNPPLLSLSSGRPKLSFSNTTSPRHRPTLCKTVSFELPELLDPNKAGKGCRGPRTTLQGMEYGLQTETKETMKGLQDTDSKASEVNSTAVPKSNMSNLPSIAQINLRLPTAPAEPKLSSIDMASTKIPTGTFPDLKMSTLDFHVEPPHVSALQMNTLVSPGLTMDSSALPKFGLDILHLSELKMDSVKLPAFEIDPLQLSDRPLPQIGQPLFQAAQYGFPAFQLPLFESMSVFGFPFIWVQQIVLFVIQKLSGGYLFARSPIDSFSLAQGPVKPFPLKPLRSQLIRPPFPKSQFRVATFPIKGPRLDCSPNTSFEPLKLSLSAISPKRMEIQQSSSFGGPSLWAVCFKCIQPPLMLFELWHVY
jgi:hypothetical protein